MEKESETVNKLFYGKRELDAIGNSLELLVEVRPTQISEESEN